MSQLECQYILVCAKKLNIVMVHVRIDQRVGLPFTFTGQFNVGGPAEGIDDGIAAEPTFLREAGFVRFPASCVI